VSLYCNSNLDLFHHGERWGEGEVRGAGVSLKESKEEMEVDILPHPPSLPDGLDHSVHSQSSSQEHPLIRPLELEPALVAAPHSQTRPRRPVHICNIGQPLVWPTPPSLPAVAPTVSQT
jgi:hypothetical protein